MRALAQQMAKDKIIILMAEWQSLSSSYISEGALLAENAGRFNIAILHIYTQLPSDS